MIMQEALPGIKRFLKSVGLKERMQGLTIRCIAAFCLHWGRMSAVQAAGAVRSEPRHRAQICRFLGRKYWYKMRLVAVLQAELLAREAKKGRFLYLTDQTLCSQQGDKTENTYSTGNRQRRPRKGKRYNKYKHTRKRCHCFVMGLLLTPSGIRIPFRRSYYTKEYCAKKGMPYRKQTELAAEMIRELPLPEGADVVVLGDTAFDAEVIREACDKRHYKWIVPMNPERVLAGPKPRPKVWWIDCRAAQGRSALSAAWRVRRDAASVGVSDRAKSKAAHILCAQGEPRRAFRGEGAARLFDTGETQCRAATERAEDPDDQRLHDEGSGSDRVV